MQPKRAFLIRLLAMMLALCMCVGMVSCAKSPFVEQNPQVNEVVNPNQENPYYQTGNDLTNNLQGLLDADDRLIKDEEGNFTVPFDLAYPEAFAAGAFEYDSTVLLLKMPKDFDGKLTEELSGCGFVSLEEFCVVTDAVWYRAKLGEDVIITEAAAAARKLDGILLVDYDYMAEKASDDTPLQTNPMAGDQWYLDSCHIQEAWDHLAQEGINPGGSSSIIVAVIDTGVDYTHPDLASSMWVNPNEIPGNGIDDDGNGYIDDIHGCSTIGSSFDHNGDPMDDHGHGTHVAGIIGAANNNVGIVGIAYNTKIMAVKAGQASGVFNQSDIAEAILYAYEMGAEVINMSFGGTACSLAVQEALQIAWSRAVLVASAGNEGWPNANTLYYSAMPNYPANLFYVIGVMSVNQSGIESSFSNWDANINGYNLYAPGENMLSTLPNGEYGYLSGTSMASPVVAGIAALLRSKFVDRDMYPAKFITGQLCATSEKISICWMPGHLSGHNQQQIADAYMALTKMPKPDLRLYDYRIFDDVSISEKNNGDGKIDAGETIYIAPILYNRWGMSMDTVVTIDAIGSLGMENPYVEIITASSNFEGVGTYSIKDQLIREENGLVIGVDEPLVIKIKDDCPNDYFIDLYVKISYKNGLDEKDKSEYAIVYFTPITFSVRNGTKLPGIFLEDTVLTNDKYYILDTECWIAENVTLTIESGVQIQQADGGSFYVMGSLIANGTQDAPIHFKGGGKITLHNSTGVVILNSCQFESDCFFDIHATEMNYCVGYSYNDRYSYSRAYANSITGCSFKDWAVIAISIDRSILECDVKHNDTQYASYGKGVYASVVKNTVIAAKKYYPYHVSFSENCMFIGSVDAQYTPSFKNCIFYSFTSSAPFNYEGVACNISGFAQDVSTGTTYIVLTGGWVSDHHDTANYALIEHIIESFGGTLACFETQEEYDFIRTTNFYGYCGLTYGEDKWISGEDVDDWLAIYELDDPAHTTKSPLAQSSSALDEFDKMYSGKMLAYLPYKENETRVCLYYGKNEPFNVQDRFIVEIPNSLDLTEEKARELLTMFDDKLAYHNLYNCSIINNFHLDPTYEWKYLEGFERLDYHECKTIHLENIYLGTSDIDLIEMQIIDFDDEPYKRDQIDPSCFLAEAPSNTMPFVVDAYLLNQNGERVRVVNNETVTFVVEFNRDMDTSVPLRVTFGSSAQYFYEDYNISQHGTWVTPRRWEATYTLRTIIENGNHTIKIENGCAADDEWLKLYDVPGRFMFEIDTTAAQALIMQGHATETGIQLTWTQDDFDTLMGYNVYRSTSEDGYYQRLNSAVIPHDQKFFFDDTVEPGKVYYYNFTVVKTDLTESEPSGKISLMSMDTMAPDIYHSPVYTAFTNHNLLINATVTDNLILQWVKLYYRVVGTEEWKVSTMTANNSRYSGLIPAEIITTDGLEYYIVAYDGVSYTHKGTAEDPYVITVQISVSASEKGDVDGDGVITNLDALLLLYALNDKYNMTASEFARADLNGDGMLSAAEALRILQYVSGVASDLTMP